VAGLEVEHLGDAQAGGVAGGQDGTMLEVSDGAEKPLDLLAQLSHFEASEVDKSFVFSGGAS